MRWLLVALVMLGGCSSTNASHEASDAGAIKTCATTSCVQGASCVTPGGIRCTCFEVGVWSCGDQPLHPGDGGFSYDSAPPPPSDGSTEYDALVSGGYSVDVTSCGKTDACAVGEDAPIGGAEAELAKIMRACFASCGASVTLSASSDGCPTRVSAKSKTTELDCVAKGVSEYFWPCATEFHATVYCPD